MHIAQINIGRLIADVDDSQVADFMNGIDEINALAEAHDGFIWRLQDDQGNATGITWNDDPRMIVNMSVWRDVASLKAFAFKSLHRDFFARRQEWFEKMSRSYFCIWQVEEGDRPDLDEARARLEHMDQHGDTEFAFGWQFAMQLGL